MNRIKKMFSVGLALACFLSFAAGCSHNSKMDGSSHLDSAEITIYQCTGIGNTNDAMQKAIASYTKTNPQIKINLETEDSQEQYRNTLRSKMESREQPTIFNIETVQDVEDWQSQLLDLSDQSWVKNSLSTTLDAVTKEGKIYGMPFSIEGYGLLINKEIFQAAGVDVDSLRTFDGMKKGFETLNEKIQNGSLKEKYPSLEAVTEFPAKEESFAGLYTSNVALAGEFDSAMDAFQAKKIEFTYAEALKELIDLQTDFTSNAKDKSKLNEVDYSRQIRDGLATERIAAAQQSSSVFKELVDTTPEVSEKLTLLPIPLHHVKEDSISVGVPLYWCVNKDSDSAQQMAAEDFLNWLYQSEEGKEIIVKDASLIPPFTDYQELTLEDPVNKEMKQYIEDGNTIPWIFQGYPNSWGEKTLNTQIQKYLGGQDWNLTVENSVHAWETLRKS